METGPFLSFPKTAFSRTVSVNKVPANRRLADISQLLDKGSIASITRYALFYFRSNSALNGSGNAYPLHLIPTPNHQTRKERKPQSSFRPGLLRSNLNGLLVLHWRLRLSRIMLRRISHQLGLDGKLVRREREMGWMI